MFKILSAIVFVSIAAASSLAAERPNILLVITDDQGYGDLGFHGNPVLKTPNLDAFAKSSVQLTNFYVNPVCSPTRASLMTGRYCYETKVVDTYLGRSMMSLDEVTISEELSAFYKYRTGLFGKWHLGDCVPLRPQDQGFEEVLTLRGGGIGQPSDPPGGSSYFDPVLFQNGQEKKFKGYITDVITDAAIDFVSKESEKPFFAYVAYNCPHAPYQVPDADWKPYRGIDLGPEAFPKTGNPWATKKLNQEDIVRAYGMIANIDANFGRLLAKVPENTLVVFLTDNGPGGVRWNGGLRNRKGTVYEGGIRVPCFIQWKGKLEAGKKIDTPTAHIDMFQTLAQVAYEGSRSTTGFGQRIGMKGWSMLPLMRGNMKEWGVRNGERSLFFQWHRGDMPEKGRAYAVRGPRYKLVQAAGVQPGEYTPKLELFDIPNDPYEQKDIAAEKPEIVQDLQKQYEKWFELAIGRVRNGPPDIYLGDKREKITTLTRQDWRGPKAGWEPDSEGHWRVQVQENGRYRFDLTFAAKDEKRTATVQITYVRDKLSKSVDVPAGATKATIEIEGIVRNSNLLEAWLEGSKRVGVNFVKVQRVAD